MAYKHETTRRHESKLFEGVVFYLNKMTEGRRVDFRARNAPHNKRIREILREQAALEKVEEAERDMARWLELQDEFDDIMISKINPEWILWGVKKIEGIESDNKPLSVEDWREWPSALFDEVVTAVKGEAELQGSERKNFELRTTSGGQVDTNPNPLIAKSASAEDSGETVIAASTSRNM